MNSGNSAQNIYVRDILHATERPPPIAVRYFYTSPFAIDDPLSPLPPPPVSGTTSPRRPPRPFSVFDNGELDRVWLKVRKELLKLGEQSRGEKSRSRAGTSTSTPATPSLRPTGTDRRNIYDPDSKRRSTVIQDGELSSMSPGKGKPSPAHEELLSVKRRSTEQTGTEDGLSSSFRSFTAGDPSFTLDESATTGRPFTRLPSRTETGRPRSVSNRPHQQTNDSYNWGDDNLASGTQAEIGESKKKEKVATKPSGPQAKVAVGISRLHDVVIPDLQ
jgi:hypothetical protein